MFHLHIFRSTSITCFSFCSSQCLTTEFLVFFQLFTLIIMQIEPLSCATTFIFVSRKFMLKFFYFKQYLQTLCAVHDLIVQSSYSNHLRPIFLCLLQSWDWLCLSYSILSWNFEKYTLKHGFIFHIYNDWKIKSTINFRISCNISTLPSFLTLPYRFFLFRCSIDMLRRIHPRRPFIGQNSIFTNQNK